jgi:hypothetical protein
VVPIALLDPGQLERPHGTPESSLAPILQAVIKRRTMSLEGGIQAEEVRTALSELSVCGLLLQVS